MTYLLRFLLYNRYAQPHYHPLDADVLTDGEPHYEKGKMYRLQLIGSTNDITTRPEFIVIKITS